MSRNPLDLGCLRLFEAAARHENLSRAAAALGMTQPALSYRIRQMEARLGTRLFERHHRGLLLSPAGRRLQEAVQGSLERLDEAVAAIVAPTAAPVVRLVTDYAFAALWLMPRMAAFRAAHPGIELQIVASQEPAVRLPAPAPDGGAELTVLFGGRREAGADGRLLMTERVAAVCSPGLLETGVSLDDDASLARAPLLHLQGDTGRRWYDWDSWLAGLGRARRSGQPGLGFNTYTLVVQAALAGQGLALGWLGLIDPLLDSGALVRAHAATLESARGYWLLAPGAGARAEVAAVAAWIAEEAPPRGSPVAPRSAAGPPGG